MCFFRFETPSLGLIYAVESEKHIILVDFQSKPHFLGITMPHPMAQLFISHVHVFLICTSEVQEPAPAGSCTSLARIGNSTRTRSRGSSSRSGGQEGVGQGPVLLHLHLSAQSAP